MYTLSNLYIYIYQSNQHFTNIHTIIQHGNVADTKKNILIKI